MAFRWSWPVGARGVPLGIAVVLIVAGLVVSLFALSVGSERWRAGGVVVSMAGAVALFFAFV